MTITNYVKAISQDRVGGYLILWGDRNKKDLAGEYFAPDTGEVCDIYRAVGRLPTLYQHGRDALLKSTVVGVIDTLRPDEVGIWAESQVNANSRYRAAIMQLVGKRVLGWSSGTLPGAREVAADGKILRWPIVEATLTPSPMEWRMIQRPVEAVKSAYQLAGISADPLAYLLEAERLALLELELSA